MKKASPEEVYKTDKGYVIPVVNRFRIGKAIRELGSKFAFGIIRRDDIWDKRHLIMYELQDGTFKEVGLMIVESWAGRKFNPREWNVLSECSTTDMNMDEDAVRDREKLAKEKAKEEAIAKASKE